ncbi:isocitrate lyase/phosphoenolpyruvate mutase family protein [Intrasporangium sp.]|uniref:isocitrate lyase/PEP mutase family protein n=1 Tax=Intrasporangium sp. TaxID=1925024 RepID=UPI00293AEE78|nr:isocitrate lyase/phosphoenolpyruvate mutase family protein [Intrasporangium sp.]MDV3220922.1 isocitrate lyase/phosphoenolpyruvate mutase family protein [Intrasporangium sp.]
MTLHDTTTPSTSRPAGALPEATRARFRDLHVPGEPLLMPNPWDAGSAKVLEHLGFRALATTSAGFAGTVGRLDGRVTRDEALRHAEQVVAAVGVPVSADFENCFAPDASGVAETVRLAAATGLAGCSIEDYDPTTDSPYPLEVAAERVAAAAEAAHAGPAPLVLTARADGLLHGQTDLDDTIARLRAFEAAGADVLYAPGVSRPTDLRRILEAVSSPVNVLALPDAPSVAELAEVGVARISVGSGFYLAAMGALVQAGRELLDSGTHAYWDLAGRGREATSAAFA